MMVITQVLYGMFESHMSVFSLSCGQLNTLRRHKATKFQRIVTNTLRIVSVGMVVVASYIIPSTSYLPVINFQVSVSLRIA